MDQIHVRYLIDALAHPKECVILVAYSRKGNLHSETNDKAYTWILVFPQMSRSMASLTGYEVLWLRSNKTEIQTPYFDGLVRYL
jgi:hypothetical protein